METNKLIAGIVAAAIAIIVLAGVLMPALSNATETEKTLTNEGYFTMDKVEGDHTLVWDHTTPKKLTVDDVVIDLTNLDLSKAYTIFGGNNFLLRLGSGTVQLFPSTGTSFSHATVGNGTDMSVSITSGTAVFTVNSDPVVTTTITLDEAYIINPNGTGEYTMKFSDGTAYIKPDSSIITMIGVTRTFDTNDMCLFATGTVEDGIEFTPFRGNTPTPTFGDVTYNMTADPGYVNVYKLQSVEYPVSQNSEDFDFTYSYFLVPTTVTAELSQHLSDAQIVILDVIPLLIIVAVLLGVVAVFILRRE